MRSRLRLRDTHRGVAIERGVVVHASFVVEHPAVTMIGELIKTQVRHEHRRVSEFAAQPTERQIEHPVGRIGT